LGSLLDLDILGITAAEPCSGWPNRAICSF